MRIGFGTTVLARGLAQGGVDGIGSYTRELMQRLAQSPDMALQPFSYAGPVPPSMATGMVNAGDFQRQALLSLATGLPFNTMQQALTGRVDLVHATDHYIPRLRGIPVVATLMDAIPLAHPEWVTYRFKRTKNALWRRSAHWAQHIITISEHSRTEIAQWFKIPEKRISVIPLGVDERWFATPAPEALARVRSHYQLPERFFLAVGTLQPRKNIGMLITAHRMLPPALRREAPLVVVGKAGWGCDDVVAQLTQGDSGALRWLQYVPDADMLPLLRQASALVFPSLHEGFGLPVLEAFAAQVPVIASNTTAVPEVAGQAALLASPTAPSAWADAMQHILAADAEANALKQLGLARAQCFTWAATCAATQSTYADHLLR
jgi:glycosyltransferase involved in cell wall biosynthesis